MADLRDERGPAMHGADAQTDPEQPRVYTHAPTGTDPELARVAMYRSAARAIFRHRTLDTEERARALVNLARRARTERYAEFICNALLAELRWDIDREETSRRREVGEPLERRHRSMRAEGYDACPRCLTTLSGPADWAHWEQIRHAAIRETKAREGAVA